MTISYYGRQTEVPADFKGIAEKKLAKYNKFFRDEAKADIVLKRNKKGVLEVELTISSAGIIYRAEKAEESFQNALDLCIATIERQIIKNKNRFETKTKGAMSIKNLPTAEVVAEVDNSVEPDVKVKSFGLSMMTLDEAILQMNLLGHPFFVFKYAETGNVAIVYTRSEGGYGLILPTT